MLGHNHTATLSPLEATQAMWSALLSHLPCPRDCRIVLRMVRIKRASMSNHGAHRSAHSSGLLDYLSCHRHRAADYNFLLRHQPLSASYSMIASARLGNADHLAHPICGAEARCEYGCRDSQCQLPSLQEETSKVAKYRQNARLAYAQPLCLLRDRHYHFDCL